MAQNLKFDPVKKDYVLDQGSPIPSDSVLEKAYYALAIPQNAWLYGVVGQGSFLYTLENIKRKASIEQQYAAFAQDALKRQLVETGDATATQTFNVQATRTGTSNQTEVVPAAQQLASQLSFVPV